MNDGPQAQRSTFIDFAEGPLRVVRAGERGSAVLLLSGAGLDNALLSWRHLIPALATEHRVFAMDWPKQGASRPWHGSAGHDRMLRCISEVLDHFGIGSVSIVGLSQGGALALAYAIERPDRVRELVALAPAGIISFPPGVHQLLWLAAQLSGPSARLSSRIFRSRAMVARLARRALFAGPVDDFDEVVDEIHREVLANGAGASDWQNASIGFRSMNVDLRPRLHEIACPTLFIQGDADIAVKPRHTAAAARRVPGARLEVLPGNGHWPNRQSPQRVNGLIAEFLAEDGSSATERDEPRG
ncbi:alpha/beta fold hydrolase [Bounagaea algeriensis]